MYNWYRNATLRNSINKLNSCPWVNVEGTKQNTVPLLAMGTFNRPVGLCADK
jgi:hypothetical protein